MSAVARIHPERIQRKRTQGWRMPETTIYVGRPTKWGNPFRVLGHESKYQDEWPPMPALEAHEAQALYWFWLVTGDLAITTEDVRSELRGLNLACWCPLEDEHGHRVPCHADVLLQIANRVVRDETP